MTGRLHGKVVVGLLVAAGAAVFLAANGHLIYVAMTSQPDCVSHVKPGEAAPAGALSAARSAC